ncbi:MAG TPA: family 16 glycoside hydrolase [Gemmataceae bacterium]|jgi:hypothetical protein|nr:family 16 glycoside hydrolase [Gemmataceae bacterium]
MSTPGPSVATAPCEVFISYASKDADRVVPLAQLLEQAGVSVWRDGDRILGGQYYGEQIVHALAHSRVVLLVCSPESFTSDNVHREVLLTWDYYHRRYLPVWVGPPAEVPERFRYCLVGCQWIDAHAQPAEHWLPQLLSALKALGVQAASRTGDPETASPAVSTGRGSGAGGQGLHFKPGDRPIQGADWELLTLLGKGGFGEVWKAHNPHLPSQPPVALKFCLRLDERGRQLLRHEADMVLRVQQQVRNDGVVPLLHAYLNSEPPCLEYPYVEGGTLVEFLDQARQAGLSLAPAQVERVVGRIAQVVAAAHRATPKLVHRDLKPANVLLERRPGGKRLLRVTDFGIGGVIAQPLLEQARTSSSLQGNMASVLTGAYTPLYASPQQVRGDKPDPRDDVYALGVIWYQLLAGDLASPAPTGRRWTEPLRQRGVGEATLDLLASCFESDPAYRPADAGVLAEGLLRLAQPGAPKGDPLDELPAAEPAAGAPRAGKLPAAPGTKMRLRAAQTMPAGMSPARAGAAAPTAPAAILRVKKAGATAPHVQKQKRLILAGVAVGVLLLGLVALWAGGVFGVKAKDGPLVADDNGPSQDNSFVRLFNGKDLTGWSVESGDERQWAVVDGVLVAKGRGLLLSKRDYANFVLRFDCRPTAVPSRSAVVFRAAVGETVRLNDQDVHLHPALGLGSTVPQHLLPPGMVVWRPGGVLPPNRIFVSKGPYEWNDVEVEIRQPELRMIVNGDEISRTNLDDIARLPDVLPGYKRSSGRIGLATIDGEIHFRNIWIKELPPRSPADREASAPGSTRRFPARVQNQHRGKWYIVGDYLVQPTLDQNASILFGDRNWTDYDFSVEAMMGEGNDQVALWFRTRDIQNAYLFGLGSWRNTALTGEVLVGGKSAIPLKSSRPGGALKAHTWYTARVSVRGNRGACFLNGVRVFAFNAGQQPAGCVGLRTWGTSYVFRNIKVTAPDGTVLLEGLPDVGTAGP